MSKLIVFLSLILVGTLKAQTKYYVAHIQGYVKRNYNHHILVVGDTINPSEKLIFVNKNDFVSIISPTKGSMIISGNKFRPQKLTSEFIAIVSDLMVPATLSETLATRSGMINSLYDLENYLKSFSDTNRLLILGTQKIPLNSSSFPDRKNRFLFIEFQLNNETINKRLIFQEPNTKKDTLYLILGKYIYEIDGNVLDVNKLDLVKVYYYNAIDKKNTFLSSIRINYSSQAELLNELRVLKDALIIRYSTDENKINKVKTEIRDYITTYWGLIDLSTLNELLVKLNI